jgi:polyhydroxyalkanoate synthesis regulator phasin
MVNKASKRVIKKIQNEIDQLKKKFKEMEIRPCQGDADLEQREKDLKVLKEQIYELEREVDKYKYA